MIRKHFRFKRLILGLTVGVTGRAVGWRTAVGTDRGVRDVLGVEVAARILPGAIERSALTIIGFETAMPVSTRKKPEGPASAVMFPPEPSSILRLPRRR